MRKAEIFRKTICFIVSAFVAVAASGCGEKAETDDSISENSIEEISEENVEQMSNEIEGGKYEKIFSDRDKNPDFSDITAEIKLDGNSASADGNGVEIDGAQVTIKQEGIYRISGTLEDGQIIVDAPDSKVQLILDGAEINCSKSSAIYGMNSKKIFISLAEGSKNILSGGEYIYENESDSEPDSCIFSKDSLTINGSGGLSVNSTLAGIHGKDDVVITGGNIDITSGAEGIKGKDYVAVSGGDIRIKSGEDGIKSTNAEDESFGFVYIEGGNFVIDAAQDGIQAESEVYICGGSFDITTNGGYKNYDKVRSDDFGGMTPPDGGFNRDDFGGMTPPDGFNPDDFGGMTPPDGFNPDDFSGMTPPDGGFNRKNFNDEKKTKTETETETEETSVSVKGIKGIRSVKIDGGTININSAGDAVHSNGDVEINANSLNIKTGNKGIHADSCAKINGGTVEIAESYEGIEAAVIEINGGNTNITSSDDGLNAADGTAQIGLGSYSEDIQITINGGLLEINAGGDGIDSNGDLTINDGTVIVSGSPMGADAALDSNGEIKINGGTVIAAGMNDMIELPSDKSEQCVISVTFDSIHEADTVAEIKEADVAFTSLKRFNNIIVSSPDIKKGGTYTVTLDGEEYTTITVDETVSTFGTQSTFGNFGGGHGNRGDRQPPTNENGEFEMPDRNFDKNFNDKKPKAEPQET